MRGIVTVSAKSVVVTIALPLRRSPQE